jgi:hypothetical protein
MPLLAYLFLFDQILTERGTESGFSCRVALGRFNQVSTVGILSSEAKASAPLRFALIHGN